ncbi:MAG: tRNA pseudouridine(55) synthase TruB [Proteobacteria bacterium]|jgi:tRNA pseudouridine55 synthase|nr:tRNA pseudouridine(55) synthase TruB [Pseudomonadota bacterium]
MKQYRQDINGVLLLNKPLGLSSNATLQKVKHLYHAKKAGHTGTLDPLATGLLPICFGEATKFSSFLLDGNKEYIATIQLGISTTTYDAEGEITEQSNVNTSKEDICNVVNSFLGKITQTPPIFSALKVNGKPLYEYARNGIDVEVKSREIEILELEILEYLNDKQFKLRILCSKGTYIRSLAHDIGKLLGCGAHLGGLVRTKTNEFSLDKRINLEFLNNMPDEEKIALLLPVDILVSSIPILEINAHEFDKIKFGNPFIRSSLNNIPESNVRLYYEAKFLGIANIMRDKVQPSRLVNL